jgi:hypothetical protein
VKRISSDKLSAGGGALDFLPPNANEDNISPEVVMDILRSVKADAVLYNVNLPS